MGLRVWMPFIRDFGTPQLQLHEVLFPCNWCVPNVSQVLCTLLLDIRSTALCSPLSSALRQGAYFAFFDAGSLPVAASDSRFPPVFSTLFVKSSTIISKPSLSKTFGSHPRIVLAFVISGLRLPG